MTRIPAGYERTHALCHAAYAWHSGQWSRTYRIACRLNRRLAQQGMTHPLDTPPASQGLSDWANELVVSNTLHVGTR